MSHAARGDCRVQATAEAPLPPLRCAYDAHINFVCRSRWDTNDKNGVRLHHLTYRGTKDECPDLVSDLMIQARVKATEALLPPSTGARRAARRVARRRPPCPPRYNLHTAILKWDTSGVGLSTTAGRMAVPFVLPEHDAKYAGGRTLTADLVHRDYGTLTVVENLTHIRARAKQRGRQSRRRPHTWSFARLRGLLEYKAQEVGCVVVGIDSRHTSQRCSRCGYTARNHRRSQSDFTCRSCGFRLHADLNGARNIGRNIARKHLAGVGTSDPVGRRQPA